MKQLLLSCAVTLSLLALMAGQSGAQVSWHQTNGPKGGAIRDVSVDSSGGLWVATARAGAYYSPDNGESWVAINTGLPSDSTPVIGMLAISAAKDGYVYAISINNERFFRMNTALPRDNWRWEELMPDSTQGPFNYIMTLPNNNVYTNVGSHGVLRSIDHGTSWVQFGDTLANINCISLAHGKSLFAAVTGNPSGPTLPHPIWVTTNGGKNWMKKADFPDYNPSQIVIAHNGNFIVTTKMKRDKFTKDTTIHGGRIYVSHDTAMTWNMVYERPDNSEDGKSDIDDIDFIESNGVIYANAHGITVRSSDNGDTWTTLDSEKRGDETFKISASADESHVYQVCEPDGVFRSDDHGATYLDKYEGMNVQFLNGMDINSKQDLLAISEFGLIKSTDNGLSWGDPVEFGESYFPSLYVSRNPATKDHIYIGCEYGFYRSTDNGETVQQFVASTVNDIYRQIGETSSGKIFTYTTGGNASTLMFTRDEGTTWDTIKNLPDQSDIVSRFAITHDSILIAGTGHTFYFSENAGAKWTTQTTTAPFNQPVKMMFAPDGSALAMIPGNTGVSGAWRSTDAGVTWLHIFPWADAPPDQFRHDYFSLNMDNEGRLLIGTDSGVFRSPAGQYTVWTNISLGLTWGNWDSTRYVNVSDIVENSVNHHYYAATRGLSVFEGIEVPGAVPTDHSVTASGSEVVNYPNPFSSTTTIAFKLDAPSQVYLDVYDAMGRHVGQIMTATLSAGDHQFPFDGRMLPSGNYLVTLRANNVTRTMWMTLSK